MTPRRKRNFLHDETDLRCPDCGHLTVVQVSSLLGTINTETVQVDPRVIQHVLVEYRERWSPDGVRCSQCNQDRPQASWLLAQHDEAIGPWCRSCLRSAVQTYFEAEKGLDKDLLVLSLQASARNHRVAGHVVTSDPKPPTTPDALLF